MKVTKIFLGVLPLLSIIQGFSFTHDSSSYENTPITPSSQWNTNFSLENLKNTKLQDLEAYDFSMKTYFKRLVANSPLNSVDSCGYVSFIQYLSYFDSFYDDRLIPEQFDRYGNNGATSQTAVSVSPGVLRQAYPNAAGTTQLYDFIQTNKNTDLQMYYMDIFNASQNRNPSEYKSSIGMWNYQKILDQAAGLSGFGLNFVQAEKNDLYRENGHESQEAIDYYDVYVKDKLDQNIPVVLHIKWEKNNVSFYHSVVAYYYDSEGIHCNFGWGANETDIVVGKNQYKINQAGFLDVSNLAVPHSKNYFINDLKYCGCGQHIHHSFSYEQIPHDQSAHERNCPCGYSDTEKHFIYEDAPKHPLDPYVYCSGCNAAYRFLPVI